MSWNHRVVKIVEFEETLYMIQEDFYNGDDKPVGYTEPSVVSETMDGLRETIARMERALSQPVLDAATDFEGEL
jgi:hypothetical protein